MGWLDKSVSVGYMREVTSTRLHLGDNMIEIGSLVLWDGVFTRALGDPKDTTPVGLYYKVIFPHTTQRCLVDELEVLS